jgi:hypothetical protein
LKIIKKPLKLRHDHFPSPEPCSTSRFHSCHKLIQSFRAMLASFNNEILPPPFSIHSSHSNNAIKLNFADFISRAAAASCVGGTAIK